MSNPRPPFIRATCRTSRNRGGHAPLPGLSRHPVWKYNLCRAVSMKLTVRPLTPDLLPALEDLFGDQGPASRCWCMYWRIGSQYGRRRPEENQAAFCDLVKNGPPPGLLAFSGTLAVGWCQLTPRDALPWLDRSWRLKRVDEVPVWALSCFYVRKGWRKKGITSALIAAALEAAGSAGAPALEAYPLDADLTPSASGTGYLSTFKRAGFRVVARHVPSRPIVRCDFQRSGEPPPGPQTGVEQSG